MKKLYIVPIAIVGALFFLFFLLFGIAGILLTLGILVVIFIVGGLIYAGNELQGIAKSGRLEKHISSIDAYLKKDDKAAVEILEKVLTIMPYNRLAVDIVSRSCILAKNYEKTIDLSSKALLIDPHDKIALTYLM